ncbi:uroporphyrinogen-III synthase isoform X2 [Phyllostomus hastatus]|uniref:uroporphyrinogen-III synthase isoform X2 n=1 Tax=Phyllostomus hastatus TaxID=9423 RepID=UPI001E67E802|nr:uroporphyrinogen-III synthase isoform X2 [Phyllostomus hastatus]
MCVFEWKERFIPFHTSYPFLRVLLLEPGIGSAFVSLKCLARTLALPDGFHPPFPVVSSASMPSLCLIEDRATRGSLIGDRATPGSRPLDTESARAGLGLLGPQLITSLPRPCPPRRGLGSLGDLTEVCFPALPQRPARTAGSNEGPSPERCQGGRRGPGPVHQGIRVLWTGSHSDPCFVVRVSGSSQPLGEAVPARTLRGTRPHQPQSRGGRGAVPAERWQNPSLDRVPEGEVERQAGVRGRECHRLSRCRCTETFPVGGTGGLAARLQQEPRPGQSSRPAAGASSLPDTARLPRSVSCRLRARLAEWQLRVSRCRSRVSAALHGDAPHSALTPPRGPPSSAPSAGWPGLRLGSCGHSHHHRVSHSPSNSPVWLCPPPCQRLSGAQRRGRSPVATRPGSAGAGPAPSRQISLRRVSEQNGPGHGGGTLWQRGEAGGAHLLPGVLGTASAVSLRGPQRRDPAKNAQGQRDPPGEPHGLPEGPAPRNPSEPDQLLLRAGRAGRHHLLQPLGPSLQPEAHPGLVW